MQQLVEKILAEIRIQGAIPFARFMELALYCPVYGYYEKEGDTVGRRGDYYTSVSVGPLFGELLARQFAEWLRQMEPEAPSRPVPPAGAESGLAGLAASVGPDQRPVVSQQWQLVEAGAHHGELARDILVYLQAREPDLVRRIEYCLVEPSPAREASQRRTLAEFGSRVRWVKELRELRTGGAVGRATAGGGVRGVIFANELLDAMPVHRLGWDAAQERWFEWGVAYDQGRFTWSRLLEPGSPGPAAAASCLDPLSALGQSWREQWCQRLPDGFTIELCPAASQWWTQAAGILQEGKLLTLDYGLEDEEWLSPARTEGTLRAYYRHRLSPDVLSRPGEQDLTAHVNFSTLRRAGEAAGLKTDGLVSQEQFLTRIAAGVIRGGTAFGQWTPARTRQFQSLTHPEHLGRAFRALVQSR